MIKLARLGVLLAFLPVITLMPIVASADDASVGVNLVNEPYKQTASEQEDTLSALQAAGVRVYKEEGEE